MYRDESQNSCRQQQFQGVTWSIGYIELAYAHGLGLHCVPLPEDLRKRALKLVDIIKY